MTNSRYQSKVSEAVFSFIYANCDKEFTLEEMMFILDMEELEAASHLQMLVGQGLLEVGYCGSCDQHHYRLKVSPRPS